MTQSGQMTAVVREGLATAQLLQCFHALQEAMRIQGQTQTDMELRLMALSAQMGDTPERRDDEGGGGEDD